MRHGRIADDIGLPVGDAFMQVGKPLAMVVAERVRDGKLLGRVVLRTAREDILGSRIHRAALLARDLGIEASAQALASAPRPACVSNSHGSSRLRTPFSSAKRLSFG